MPDPMDGFKTAMGYTPPQLPMDTGADSLGFLSNVNTSPTNMGWDGFMNSIHNAPWLTTTDKATGATSLGLANMGLGAASGLMSGWLGMQQYGLAKDALAQQKKAFGLNYDAQVKTTNARLNDVAASRYASNPNAYQSPSSYMKQYGIGG